MRLAIIDYGMGNLRSVANAFEALGCNAEIVVEPPQLAKADRIVLPGVGAFGDGVANLRSRKWIETLEIEVREKGKPFIGLCVGMQLLATTGSEQGTHQGLNWIESSCLKLESLDPSIRVPHIGWNKVRFLKKDGMYAGLSEEESYYFVHSYVVRPVDTSVVSGVCLHGVEFAASFEFENIWATQFHPEKSQKAGLAVLNNFLKMKT